MLQSKTKEKLWKIVNGPPPKQLVQKRSVSRDCRSIPVIRSSRVTQRRNSQEEHITKILDFSTIDPDGLNTKKQIDIVLHGLEGLMSMDLVMKKEKVEELIQRLKKLLYLNNKANNISMQRLKGLNLLNAQLSMHLSETELLPLKDVCDLLIQELLSQAKRIQFEEVRFLQIKQELQGELNELKIENKELRTVIIRLENQVQQHQIIFKTDKLVQQSEDLKRYNRNLSKRNDYLAKQNQILIQKIQGFYQTIDSFNEQLTLSKFGIEQYNGNPHIKMYSQELQSKLNEQMNDILDLKLTTPEKYVEVDFKTEVLDMTPRPNYEYLYYKYPSKIIKQLRQLKSTQDIFKYLLQNYSQL